MKRNLALNIMVILVVAMMFPVSALDLYSNTVSNVFDELPSEYANAVVIPFSESWTEGATNARHGSITGQINDFDYVYLKADSLGDFTVSFNVDKDGLYHFGFTVMGWTASVLRSTNVKIDDSEFVYLAYDYVEENQYHNHYWYGISAVLSAGEHTVTLSLADDFDDSAVKSLYFANFFYIQTDLPAAVEETAAVTEVAVVSQETVAAAADPVIAPQTFDIITVGLAAVVVALSGMVLSKKKK
ncbi:MAG: hypothetical protein ACYCWE_14260 [Eubacteriales bacterium]